VVNRNLDGPQGRCVLIAGYYDSLVATASLYNGEEEQQVEADWSKEPAR